MIPSKGAVRRRKLIALTFSVSFLAAPHAQAFEQSVVVGAKHFFECLGLLLTDSYAHEQECLPNRVVGPFDSIASSTSSPGTVAPPPPPPPPPPVVVPPPPPPPPPPVCVCGPCYPRG